MVELIEGGSPGAVDAARGLLEDGGEVCLQFVQPPYPRALLKSINELCRDHGERLEVRFYGHYSATFDCAKLANLPDAQSLSIDCLQTARNVEAIGEHTGLRRFSFGVYRHDQTDLLERIEAGHLRELRLDENARRNIDLAPLAGYGSLESLSLEGHTKGIDSLTGHPRLRSLGLRCIPQKRSLDFVSTIPRLRSLKVVLGGREDIAEVESASLEELEIALVRGFQRCPDLDALPSLRSLRIEGQVRLADITVPASTSSRLESLNLQTCKALRRLDGLAHLAHLVDLRLSITALDLGALVASGLPDSLRTFAFFTGSQRRNDEARALLEGLGYGQHRAGTVL